MTIPPKQLLFTDVDGLAFAAANGGLADARVRETFEPKQIGPILELLHLRAGGRVPSLGNWLSLNTLAPFVSALESARESWFTPANQQLGFIRAVRHGPEGDGRLTSFLMTAKRAGRECAGLSTVVAGQLVAAMQELENNVHEHAEAAETGVIAYRAEPGEFEFVAADRGIGILASLRRYVGYAALPDDGKALEAALTDGVSRHGRDSNRGHGFRPIFTGLMNLSGELRFRSGDHAITIDGTSPTLATSRIAQKAPIDGFFASVRCRTSGE